MKTTLPALLVIPGEYIFDFVDETIRVHLMWPYLEQDQLINYFLDPWHFLFKDLPGYCVFYLLERLFRIIYVLLELLCESA